MILFMISIHWVSLVTNEQHQCIKNNCNESADEIKDALVNMSESWSDGLMNPDDITIVVIKKDEIVPDHVFFGLIEGKINGPRSVFPKIYAIVSFKKEISIK